MTGFPNYFRGPRLEKLYFTSFNDPNAEFSALQNGAIDVMDWPLTTSQINKLDVSHPNPAYQINFTHHGGGVQVIFDAGRYPSNYTSYRQAFAYMIDRDDVITTALQGLGGKPSDLLSPAWPTAWHVPGGIGYDINLALANQTLYKDGWRYSCRINSSSTGCGGSPDGLGGFWYHTPNGANIAGKRLDPSTTIFYARQDDPNRLYLGLQVATMQGATKSTYHFDRLFTVNPVTSYVTTRTVYRSPTSSGGYTSNNCNGVGYPCFTAYTQGLSLSTSDPDWLYYSFGPDYLDVPFQNFGHYVNATVNNLLKSMFMDPVLNNTKVQLVNRMIMQNAWYDPIYYNDLFFGLTSRVTGHHTAQNSVINGGYSGAFGFGAWQSYLRGHLKGRTFGGSLRTGIYNPISELNIFNPNSDWIYDAIVYNRLYDSLLNFNPDTGGLIAGLASNYSVATFTGPVYNSRFQSGTPGWATSSLAPYWTHTGSATHIVSGEKISYTLLSNATWHDGSTITPNDLVWNIVTDASDANNLLSSAFGSLDDANVTGNTVNLYFNSTNFDLLLVSGAYLAIAPPLPWIHHSSTWAGTAGVLSGISLSTKASLNLSAAGGLNMLDGSGPFKFDTSSNDPFTLGSTFDLLANNNWYYRDSAKATYDTGIVDMTAYANSALISPASLNVRVALVNGNNSKGLFFSGGDYRPDPTTRSDTVSGATVLAQVYEKPSLSTTLSYNFTSGLWEGMLTGIICSGNLTCIYHVQITATTAKSTTTYGPSGSLQASATGISWEGDPVHTAFRVTAASSTPFTPQHTLIASLLIIATTVLIQRTKKGTKNLFR